MERNITIREISKSPLEDPRCQQRLHPDPLQDLHGASAASVLKFYRLLGCASRFHALMDCVSGLLAQPSPSSLDLREDKRPALLGVDTPHMFAWDYESHRRYDLICKICFALAY